MNIVIVGGGAIGLLWYQGLNKLNNVNVSVKTRHPTANFYFTNLQGETQNISVTQASAHHIESADVIMLCVKAFQVQSVIREISPLISENTTIIFNHNGLGVHEEITCIEQENIHYLTLITTHGCKRISKENIIHTGEGVCDIGVLSGEFNTDQQTLLLPILSQALPKVCWQNDIKHKQWVKLAVNCVINPITAIENIANGELIKPQYRQQILSLVEEFIDVANSQGFSFTVLDILNTILDVAEKTAANSSSMRADISNRRKTEVDYINGYLIKVAEAKNIQTPMNKKVFLQLKVISGQVLKAGTP